MTKVLITGGAGFIGSHLAGAFVAAGAGVRVLDDLSTGSLDNLEALPVELVVGDICDPEVVDRAVQGCDLLIHQAALVSVPKSIENPALTYRTNVTGTFNLFEAARQEGIRRVVYASSSAVYGNLPGLPKREDDALEAGTPYAASKLMIENLANAYRASYGMDIAGLRYMNVFGPRQDPSSPYSGVLSLFCQAAISGDLCTVYGDGEQTRDFIYVNDVVQANLLAAKAPADKLPDPAIFNIGRGEQNSLNQILDMLAELTGGKISVAYEAARPGDIKHSVADINRARKCLDFRPEVSVVDGLRDTLEWFGSKRPKPN
jgi:UDP-glucose 4-epimerase